LCKENKRLREINAGISLLPSWFDNVLTSNQGQAEYVEWKAAFDALEAANRGGARRGVAGRRGEYRRDGRLTRLLADFAKLAECAFGTRSLPPTVDSKQ
jgi:hypothetical protein